MKVVGGMIAWVVVANLCEELQRFQDLKRP